MNLGDGLKLETQILNGKTKLILAPYDVHEKTNKQVGYRGRPQRPALKAKYQPQVLHTVQNNNEKPEQLTLRSRSGKVAVGHGRPPTNVLKELENKKQAPVIQQNAQPAKPDAGKAKSVPKKFSSVPKLRSQHKPAISAENLRESLVCLTQEQFQQILRTINQNNKPNVLEQTEDNDADKQETEESIASLLHAKEDDVNPMEADKDDSLLNNQPKDMQTGSLFSTLGEREKDKSLQEAKKAQWKRELDEQVALKKKLKEADQDGINIRHRDGIESSVSERTPFSDLQKNTPLNDFSTPDSMFKTSPGTEFTDSSPAERASSFSSPELPAAIRSAFVVGEAAPMDHPFSAVKRQQQKKWLEELNKQREEAALRKVKEKQKIQEAEQQDLWAMHFDSFKKAVNCQTPVYQNTSDFQLSEQPPSLEAAQAEHQLVPAISNPLQEQPETRASIEEDFQKAGFLRTMTALLDPAQIEERDRKRQKQLEHQKAIAAQVEEKRKRKQLEDEQRQQEEQEEERRLAKEREQLQMQYEEDAFRQKQKEDALSWKTRELHQSMQRAQEEALRLKQEHRMRHLLQKGHDVSNLQKNAAGEAVHLDLSRAASHIADVIPEGYQSGANSVMKQSVTTLISPRKDTAVQTDDLDPGIKPGSVSHGPSWRREQNASPDIPIEFTYQQSMTGLPGKKGKAQRERSESTKENTIIDVYDQYSRIEKQVGEPGRKLDWNRNRPQKKYIPASERYPKGQQRQREESKVRRQMELLQLVEKNSSNNLTARKGHSPERSPGREEAKISHPLEEVRPAQEARKEEKVQKVDPYFKRPDSPPVPAIKNRLNQAQRRSNVTPAPIVYSGNPISTQINISPELDKQEAHRPPSSQFIPYVRTKEIYYLDPDAPMSRPSTHDPQYKHTAGDQESRQIFSSDHARDPLLNPNVVRNKDRQQAILRGLSELRKGLLQKQRELETGLMPDV